MPDAAALEFLSQGTQRRARAQLSCTACRAGKLKCNRQHPCDQCIKRNKDSTCGYVAAPQRKKPNQSMKDRIKHLEGLVVALYTSNNSNGKDDQPEASRRSRLSNTSASENESPQDLSKTSDPTPESEDQTRAFGRLNIGKTETKYVAPSHWEAILDNIAEVRSALDDDEHSSDGVGENTPESDASAPEVTVQSLLRPNPTIRMSREDIIRAIPPKSRTDTLIALYFKCQSPSVCLLHGPTFQSEYSKYWQNPDSASTMWIALFLSMLSIAARVSGHRLDKSDAPRPSKGSSSEETQRLQSLTASTLILAPYTRPTAYTVQALVCYLEGEYAEGDECHFEVWLLLGVTLRIALRMGYHRDADSSGIGAFEGEMRRRAWCLLYSFDTLISFQLGLPGMLLSMQFDVKLPHNLMDQDFGPGSTVLPPSRPDTDFTNTSYIRTKMMISQVFGKAAEMSHAIHPAPFSEVLVQAKRLQDVHDAVPANLRVRPLDQCFADTPGVIMIRFNLELLVQKTRCLLHRRYLTENIDGEGLEFSRSSCVDAAQRILHQLSFADTAFEAGMMPPGWFIASLNTHDFLLAAMIIALDLDRRLKKSSSTLQSESLMKESDDMHTLLESTYQIFQKPIHRSTETDKASKALMIMLTQIKRRQTTREVPRSSDDQSPWITTNGASNTSTSLGTDTFALQAQTPWTEQPTPMEVPTNTGMTPFTMDYGSTNFEPIGNMLDMPMDMDWQTWDTYIFNQNPSGGLSQRYPNAFDATDFNFSAMG